MFTMWKDLPAALFQSYDGVNLLFDGLFCSLATLSVDLPYRFHHQEQMDSAEMCRSLCCRLCDRPKYAMTCSSSYGTVLGDAVFGNSNSVTNCWPLYGFLH